MRALERSGFHVTCCPDGRSALATLVNSSWDAAVLDVRMPQMDGVQLLEVLRSYLRFSTLPVIILTAHATPEQLDRIRELNVERVFQKANYDLPDLIRAVAQALPPC